MDNLKYLIALKLIHKIGNATAKQLVAYCGSAEAIFKTSLNLLVKIPSIGEVIARNIKNFKDFDRVEKEIEFIEKNKIDVINYWSDKYPKRLKQIDNGRYNDAPFLLFYKGTDVFDNKRFIGVVGTRKCTNYGKNFTTNLVAKLQKYGVTIVSGLAFGIDYEAQKAAYENSLPTIGVVAHGLDMIYPKQHRDLAGKITRNGGILTEYLTQTNLHRGNFPERNRIIAGLVDALVVVETATKGGALITAEIAASYNREIFAMPGRVNDLYSDGCNNLIRKQKALLLKSEDDIAYNLGWELKVEKEEETTIKLPPNEQKIRDFLIDNGKTHIDVIAEKLEFRISDLSVLLLNLEFANVVRNLPGNLYETT